MSTLVAGLRRYQMPTALLIPKMPFTQVVTGIAVRHMVDIRFQASALAALQEAAEAFIVAFLESK
jgi:histone H3